MNSFPIMSDIDEAINAMVEQAAGIITASANKVPLKEAMRLVGFSEEERARFHLQQKVRRRSLCLVVMEKGKTSTTPQSAVNAIGNASATSDLTNSTSQKRKAKHSRAGKNLKFWSVRDGKLPTRPGVDRNRSNCHLARPRPYLSPAALAMYS